MPAALQAALPPGWTAIGRCRRGAGLADHPTGCHVLAHPGIGVALLDLAPDATPNAEPRLRRLLASGGFRMDFPGTLPVWHGRMEPTELRRLPLLLRAGFATLPALTVPGGDAWVGAVRAVLDADPAWEAAGRAKPMPAIPVAPAFEPEVEGEEGENDDEPAPWRMRGRRPLLLGLGFVTVFALGLAAGLGLAPGTGSAPPARGGAEAPMGMAAPGLARDGARPAGLAGDGAPLPPYGSGSFRPAWLPPPEASPQEAAPPRYQGMDDGAPGTLADAVPPEEATGSEDMPLPPPEIAPPPPEAAPQPSPRPAPRAAAIDRRCSEAMFRWQQGERLSWSEMAYVREGCASTRR